jgi:hypothetical protein
MKTAIRLAVVAVLALGSTAARADHDPYSANAPHPDEAQASSETPEAKDAAPAPAKVQAGAGGMEPGEAIDEDPGTPAHQAWVESIWTDP